ncbi:hypothetical protein D3C86_767870 [compost metagenome]
MAFTPAGKLMAKAPCVAGSAASAVLVMLNTRFVGSKASTVTACVLVTAQPPVPVTV